jgi:hypothetical protein
MFGFWLPIGLLIASLCLIAIAIAKKHNRITTKTYRLAAIICSAAVVTLSIDFCWSSYQMEQTLNRLEGVKARADILENHIKAAEAQRHLMHFADPLQEPDPITQQKYQEALRNKGSLIGDETRALIEEQVSARTQLDELNQARMQREFVLFLCVLVPATTLVVGAIFRDAIRGRRVKGPAA